MSEKLRIRSSAISEVVRFPVLNHIILGGAPFFRDIFEKSASKVTIVKSFSPAYRHIISSSQSISPTELTWRQSVKLSGSKWVIRNDMFWSNSNRISDILQVTFMLLRRIIKAGKNVIVRKFGEVCNYFVIGHSFRQPSQNIINGYPGVSDTRFPKTLGGVDCDNVAKSIHDDKIFYDATKIEKIKLPRLHKDKFFMTEKVRGNFFLKKTMKSMQIQNICTVF